MMWLIGFQRELRKMTSRLSSKVFVKRVGHVPVSWQFCHRPIFKLIKKILLLHLMTGPVDNKYMCMCSVDNNIKAKTMTDIADNF